MMSVYQRASGGVYYYDFRLDGARYSGCTGTENLVEAREFERIARADVARVNSFCRTIIRKAKKGKTSRRSKRGYVYMMRSGYFIKIGQSNDPAERFRAISTATPDDCELLFSIPGDLSLERQLHREFAASHYKKEWFFLCGKLKQFIEQFEIEKQGAKQTPSLEFTQVASCGLQIAEKKQKSDLEIPAPKSGALPGCATLRTAAPRRGFPLEHFRFFQIAKTLYLFVFTQFRTENRFPLFEELL